MTAITLIKTIATSLCLWMIYLEVKTAIERKNKK